MSKANIARIHDRLGMAATFLGGGKIEMQKLWLNGLDWDEGLLPASQNSRMNIFTEMHEMNHVIFQRALTHGDVNG